MNILVTGGMGYIGSHTCVELLNAGPQRGRSSTTCATATAACSGASSRSPASRSAFVEADIRDRAAVEAAFDAHEVDAVIHFAGLKAVGESVQQPLRYYDNNVTGSIVLFETMAKFGVKTLVFSSSATVYGDPASVPITEDFPLSATNAYGRSKLMIEEMLRDLARAEPDWRIALLRYFNPVGAHESGLIGEDPATASPTTWCPTSPRSPTGQREQLSVYGGDYPTPDGTGMRDYIHVVDLALGHVKTLDKLATADGVVTYNLGTGRGNSVLEMVRAFEQASGKPIPYQIVARRPGDIAKCYADPSRAQRRAGLDRHARHRANVRRFLALPDNAEISQGHHMKAMILAAGKGTRVRPLTYDLPKPMIPLLGKPVMAYLVEHLAKYGVTEIMVNVSYLHEKIEEYFGEGDQFGVQIGYSFEGYTNDDGEVVPMPIGSAGGMKKIQEFGGFFDQTTIVLCGDALIDLDLKSALFEHKRKGALASVVTARSAVGQGVELRRGGGRRRRPHHRVPGKAGRRTRRSSNFISTGIYIFEPEVIDLIPSGVPFDIGSELFPLLAERGLPFYAQRRPFNWLDIGSVSDYWEVLQNVLMGEVAHMDMPGTQIEDGLWVGLNTSIDWDGTTIEGPVYIGSGCKIEAGVHIVGPTWIGHGSHICEGAEVVRSVLFEYTRVLADVSLA